jgi:S-adenosylmethionine-dependent methyltransferase
MPTSSSVFDATVDKWIAEQQTPWARLRYAVAAANLQRHLGPGSLRVLDAGGGNGHESLPFAAAGHHVTLVDYSAGMLAAAHAVAEAAQLQAHVTMQQAEVTALAELFAPDSFDVVLCHNVLQYVDDVPALLAALAAPLRAGGLLSLISTNRYASPYRDAFLFNDLARAYAQLDRHANETILFGTTVTEYSADEILPLLPAANLDAVADYGIRCVCDYWGDNARKSDPATFAQLEQLEFALTDRHPYKWLARFYQIVARKREG